MCRGVAALCRWKEHDRLGGMASSRPFTEIRPDPASQKRLGDRLRRADPYARRGDAWHDSDSGHLLLHLPADFLCLSAVALPDRSSGRVAFWRRAQHPALPLYAGCRAICIFPWTDGQLGFNPLYAKWQSAPDPIASGDRTVGHYFPDWLVRSRRQLGLATRICRSSSAPSVSTFRRGLCCSNSHGGSAAYSLSTFFPDGARGLLISNERWCENP